MNPVTAIIQRNLLNYTRNRGRMIGSIVMSMFMLVMFSFMMKSSMSGFGEPMNYLIAGVIIMTVFQTGINNSSDILSDTKHSTDSFPKNEAYHKSYLPESAPECIHRTTVVQSCHEQPDPSVL